MFVVPDDAGEFYYSTFDIDGSKQFFILKT